MNWFKRATSKWQHRLFANTLHGTHSPFVYEMLEKVVYAPKKAKNLSELVLRLQLYYHLKDTLGIGYAPNEVLKNKGHWFEFDEQVQLHVQKEGKVDLLLLGECHHPRVLINYFNAMLPYCAEHSLVIIDNISETEVMQQAWHTICQLDSVKQCLDFYDFGILLFRKQQAKEYFRLKWK